MTWMKCDWNPRLPSLSQDLLAKKRCDEPQQRSRKFLADLAGEVRQMANGNSIMHDAMLKLRR